MPAPATEPIGLQLTRTAKSVSRSFDAALASRGGSLATWLVLMSLAGEPHVSQRSIAEAVGIEGPTLTHHLHRMEDDGLVTRQRDPQDRRNHQVALSEDGRARFGSLLEAVTGFDEQLRAGFSEAELTTLRTLLQRLAANAAADPGPRGRDRKELP